MKATLEKHIERDVCQHAKNRAITVYKFSSPAHRAVPDRLFIYRGTFWFFEFKRHGEKTSPAQKREHKRLRDAGATVFVIDSPVIGKWLIDAFYFGVDPTRIQTTHRFKKTTCH